MNKTVLITGTTSGVGASIAHSFIEKRWNVIGFARGVSLFNFKNYEHHMVDIMDPFALEDAFREIGKIDILINNAGNILRKPAAEHPDEYWNNIIDINLNAQFIITREIGKQKIGRAHV